MAFAAGMQCSRADRLSCDATLARALVCAAVRETFEESGVVLASPGDGALVRDTTGEDWAADRLALIDGVLSLGEFLVRRSLVLRADPLRAWSQWITPEWSPRRFDTRFVVAAVPDGQRTRDVGGEAARSPGSRSRKPWTATGTAHCGS